MSVTQVSRMNELMSKELLDINEAKELGHLRIEYLLTHEEFVVNRISNNWLIRVPKI